MLPVHAQLVSAGLCKQKVLTCCQCMHSLSLLASESINSSHVASACTACLCLTLEATSAYMLPVHTQIGSVLTREHEILTCCQCMHSLSLLAFECNKCLHFASACR